MHALRIIGLVLAVFGVITGVWGVLTHGDAADSAGAIEAIQLWAGLGIGSTSLAVILISVGSLRRRD